MLFPRIAIIDSGATTSQIDSAYKIDVLAGLQNSTDHINHGSIIFQIIKKYAPNALLRIIKITDDMEIKEQALCTALRVLLRDLDVDIVNISMGIVVSEMTDEIIDLCEQLKNKGVILVAAFDNDGAMSYPAAASSVIGVDLSPKCKLVNQYEYIQDDVINIRAFSGILHVKVDNNVFSVSGTSFTCAIMTAKIANLLNEKYNKYEQVMEKLEKNATYIVKNKEYKPIPTMFEIKKAIIFPFNKEMYSLLANQDLLGFSVVGVFDPVQLGKVGRKLSDELKGDLRNDFTIRNIFNINWEEDFDTFILGHTREISETLGFSFKEHIVQKCKEYRKKLYAFDNIDTSEIDVYVPRVLESNVPKNRYGKLYQVHCPVLGILGTSSKQGKFSLQLKLRRLFLHSEYHLAQIGTEPSSLLFGMDAVYPMGYDGIVPNNPRDSIIMLNDMLRKSVKQDTDIVLVGAQSGSGVYSYQNTSLFPLETMHLLLGMQPDAILLCVNIFDDDDYIYRTIMCLENMIDTYVIALVISPVDYMYIESGLLRKTKQVETERMNSFQEHLKRRFKKEVFILDFETSAKEIYDYTIKILQEGNIQNDL